MKKLLVLFILFFNIFPVFAEMKTSTWKTLKTEVNLVDKKTDIIYTYYYWDGCGHCIKVDKFLKEHDWYNKLNIKKFEVFQNKENAKKMLKDSEELWVKLNWITTPFIIAKSNYWNKILRWDREAMIHFSKVLNWETIVLNDYLKTDKLTKEEKKFDSMKFLFVLILAAIWDSINPCAFAVMFILLSSILRQHKSRKKVLFSGFMFILAIFISYLAIWKWLYSALASTSNTNTLKIWAWILWIIVWLANLKDYFWYWKYFRMEVPTSWRPKMKKIIKWITSPFWAFFIWFIVSLFLLPCTSWPYIAVLWYLSWDSNVSVTLGNIYLIIYNLIFIIPMVIITILVAFWVKNIWELKEYKELNVEKIHLVTWIIMLLLWIYILYDVLI